MIENAFASTPYGQQYLNILAKFRVLDIGYLINPIFIPLVASLFVLSEIGIKKVISRKKKLDLIQSFGLVVGILGLVSVALYFIGIKSDVDIGTYVPIKFLV